MSGYMENLSSSALGSAFILLSIGVAWCVKNKMKQSKCASHNSCCDFEVSSEEEQKRERKKRNTENREDFLKLLKEFRIDIPSLEGENRL